MHSPLHSLLPSILFRGIIPRCPNCSNINLNGILSKLGEI